MDVSDKNAPTPGASSPFVPFGKLPEDEQIALIIKLFGLGPVLDKSGVLWVTGDTKHDFYAMQDENDSKFDPSYPKEIRRRRSKRVPRRYWTIDVLRWLIRHASQTDERGRQA